MSPTNNKSYTFPDNLRITAQGKIRHKDGRTGAYLQGFMNRAGIYDGTPVCVVPRAILQIDYDRFDKRGDELLQLRAELEHLQHVAHDAGEMRSILEDMASAGSPSGVRAAARRARMFLEPTGK